MNCFLSAIELLHITVFVHFNCTLFYSMLTIHVCLYKLLYCGALRVCAESGGMEQVVQCVGGCVLFPGVRCVCSLILIILFSHFL